MTANFGYYFSPGYKPIPYAGVVPRPVELCLSSEVMITVPQIRHINSNCNTAIIGFDALCAGRPFERWNFVAMPVQT